MKGFGLFLGLLVLSLVLFQLDRATGQLPAPVTTWRNTGIPPFTCFDPVHPHVVYTAAASGTLAYNWDSGAASFVSAHPVSACGPDGLLYSGDIYQTNPFWRFSAGDPAGERMPYFPTHFAQDGSRYLYSSTSVDAGEAVGEGTGELFASSDGGATWQKRGAQFGDHIQGFALAAADARVVYIVVNGGNQFSIYGSADAGLTWDRRYTSAPQDFFSNVQIAVPPGATAPVDLLVLQVGRNRFHGDNNETYYLSGDGGRTLNPAFPTIPGFFIPTPQLVHSRAGVVRWVQALGPRAGPPFYTESYTQSLSLTTDQGYSWQPLGDPPLPGELPMPYPPPTAPPPPLPTATLGPAGPPLARLLQVASVAPANLFLSSVDLFYSPDGGLSWQQLDDTHPAAGGLYLTPYLPLSVLRPGGGPDRDIPMAVRDFPDAGRAQTAPVPASHAPGSRYFPSTGHNVAERFLRYWDTHGGQAQFGLPRSEAFPEVSATDGLVYFTQYFERARFEYHPEWVGSASEIELGLLGSEITAGRRAMPPFEPVGATTEPGVSYFAQTGHTLRGPFRSYWQSHGGLALYGYPISEQFSEPGADGRVYVVQYFQRNRFEYHPEHAGSPYEVLLGLLGNDVVHRKGWP